MVHHKVIRRTVKARRPSTARRRMSVETPRSFMGMLAMLGAAGERLERARPRRSMA